MTYKLVFDISQQPYPWWIWIIFLGFFVIGVGFIVKPAQMAKRLARPNSFGRVFGIIWLSIWAVMVPGFIQSASDYTYYHSLASSRNYAVVEGAVSDFSPMPYGGGATESFVVNGVEFQYSDYDLTPGFNNTSSHGGPIKAGLHQYLRQN